MPNLQYVYRVRIDTALRRQVKAAYDRWRKANPWQRPGTFYRLVLKHGIAHFERKK